MIRGIDRILIRVTGLAAAVRHYRDVLGLALLREEKGLAVFRLADGTAELVLHVDPDLPADATYLLVDDVRDLHRRRGEVRFAFVGPPTRVARGYRATVRDPFGAVLHLIDRTGEAARGGGTGTAPAAGGVEDARPASAGLFPGVTPRAPVRRARLAAIYRAIGRTADDLPYTPHFEDLYQQYIADQPEPRPDHAEVWRHLLTTRKAGQLPKLGEARSLPPEVTDEERARLRELLGADIGKRDRLPYTPRFDAVAEAFNRGRRRAIAPHPLWRLIATLAK
jgi:catechol 2,3-dioxygenase-like lactoylglutathione lyase family enzyme